MDIPARIPPLAKFYTRCAGLLFPLSPAGLIMQMHFPSVH